MFTYFLGQSTTLRCAAPCNCESGVQASGAFFSFTTIRLITVTPYTRIWDAVGSNIGQNTSYPGSVVAPGKCLDSPVHAARSGDRPSRVVNHKEGYFVCGGESTINLWSFFDVWKYAVVTWRMRESIIPETWVRRANRKQHTWQGKADESNFQARGLSSVPMTFMDFWCYAKRWKQRH
jgi:hypothetical protein